MTITRSFSELLRYETFEERLDYLKLSGAVGRSTFGFDRWLNQRFYTSYEWKRVRRIVILRDNGCDLGVAGYEIFETPLIHHINPLTPEDILNGEETLLDPDFLITTSHATHNAIHFGADRPGPRVVTERTPGDTKIW
jgi:hypothetical protein